MKKERPSAKNNWGCSPEWKTSPISPSCEVGSCENPTDFVYPAMGGGWQALCFKHGLKHVKHGGVIDIQLLIQGGEKFAK